MTRERPDGTTEVLVVHRPRYDDWSLPKGKLHPGESFEEAARREVEEETGCRCRLLDELGVRHYQDRHGRPKEVRYWRMAVEGEVEDEAPFVPNDEVDEVRWLPIDEAATLLSYDGDRRLLEVLGAQR
ncbi:MAG: 8-oxo-dGTP diphosphatase [Actinomycetota bacterium]|nr:8-oxo-dGTP diphosphatase [Actinomycetota bacterium]